MARIKVKKLRQAKGRKEYKHEKGKRERREIAAIGEEGWVQKSLEEKPNVLVDQDLDELQELPIKGNTIEYWITPVGRAKIQAWKRAGLSKQEIAVAMGINYQTLYRWERDFSLIREAMSLGLEEMVMSAEHALVQKALGYEQREVTRTYDSEGKETVRETNKFIAPDFQSLKFLLTNMKPETWKDKQDITVDNGNAGKFANMTDEELAAVVSRFSDISGEELPIIEGDWSETN